MKIIQKIKCWRYGHQWTDPFRSLYTDYQLWHQNCVVCGEARCYEVTLKKPEMGKPLQGNKKERKHARQKRRVASVSRFKKASKGM